jgi:hypothetical protein
LPEKFTAPEENNCRRSNKISAVAECSIQTANGNLWGRKVKLI